MSAQESQLEKGDVFMVDDSFTVYAKVPKHFLYSNAKGDFSVTKSNVKTTDQLAYLQGRYIVISTAFDGGSSGRDSYPNGHHVYAERDDGMYEIDFYQSGSFTAMMPNVKTIGTAKLKFVIED